MFYRKSQTKEIKKFKRKIIEFTKDLLDGNISSITSLEARYLINKLRTYDDAKYMISGVTQALEKHINLFFHRSCQKTTKYYCFLTKIISKVDIGKEDGFQTNLNDYSAQKNSSRSLGEISESINKLTQKNYSESLDLTSSEMTKYTDKSRKDAIKKSIDLKHINSYIFLLRERVQKLQNVIQACYIYDQKDSCVFRKSKYALDEILDEFFCKYIQYKLKDSSDFILKLIEISIVHKPDLLSLLEFIKTLKKFGINHVFEDRISSILYDSHKKMIFQRFYNNDAAIFERKIQLFVTQNIRKIIEFFQEPATKILYNTSFTCCRTKILRDVVNWNILSLIKVDYTLSNIHLLTHFLILCDKKAFLKHYIKHTINSFTKQYFQKTKIVNFCTNLNLIFCLLRYIQIQTDYNEEIVEWSKNMLSEIVSSNENMINEYLNEYIHIELQKSFLDRHNNLFLCISCEQYCRYYNTMTLNPQIEYLEDLDNKKTDENRVSAKTSTFCVDLFEILFKPKNMNEKNPDILFINQYKILDSLRNNKKAGVLNYFKRILCTLFGFSRYKILEKHYFYTDNTIQFISKAANIFLTRNVNLLEQNLNDFSGFLDLSIERRNLCFFDMILIINFMSNRMNFFEKYMNKLTCRLLTFKSDVGNEFYFLERLSIIMPDPSMFKMMTMVMDFQNIKQAKNCEFLLLNRFKWSKLPKIDVRIPRGVPVSFFSLPKRELTSGYTKIFTWSHAFSTCIIIYDGSKTRVNLLQYIILHLLQEKPYDKEHFYKICKDTGFVDRCLFPLLKHGIVVLVDQKLRSSDPKNVLPSTLIPEIEFMDVNEHEKDRIVESNTASCNSVLDCRIMLYMKKNRSSSYKDILRALKLEFQAMNVKIFKDRISHLIEFEFLSEKNNILHYVP